MVRGVEGAVTPGGFDSTGGSEVTAPRLRPLGIGETLDVAIKLYRNNAMTLWKVVALVIVPIEIIEVIVRRLALPSDVFVYKGSLYTFTTGGSSGTSSTVALIVIAFAGLLGQLLSTGAAFKVVTDAYLGRAPDWRESLAFARHRLLSLLWLGIIVTVLVVIGFILIVIPGVWLLVATCVSVPVLMLEGLTGFKAMTRSMQLVDTRWWATFARVLVAFLLYGVITFVIGAIVGGLTDAFNVTSVTLWVAIDGVLRGLVIILMTPFIAAVITVIYIDLRVRKEALDLELLAQHFGGPGSTLPAGTAAPTVAAADAGLPHDAPPAPSEPTWPPEG
jgi:hypothetical protein